MIFNIKIHTLKKKRAAFNWVVWICQSGFGMPVPYPSFSSKQKQLGIIHEATQESNNVNIRYTKYCVDWMKLTQRIWLRRKKTQACHFKLRSLQCRLEKPNNRYILKRFLSSSLPFGLLPLCFLDHLSLLYLLLFSSPLPPPFFFYHSLFLWMSCPQITGVCGGLSETCVEVWRRLMGSPSSSCSPSFLPKSPSQWGRKTLSEFKDRILLGFFAGYYFPLNG